MKTAEEWNDEYRRICASDPAVHGQLLPNPQNIAFIKRVQYGCMKAQREIDAVNVANLANEYCGKECERCEQNRYLSGVILLDRTAENLTELPKE